MYDGEGKVAWLEHLHNFLSIIHEEHQFCNKRAGLLLAYTLRKSQFHWVLNLPYDTIHSFEHFCDFTEDTFYHFDLDHIDGKLLQQRRATHESVIHFLGAVL